MNNNPFNIINETNSTDYLDNSGENSLAPNERIKKMIASAPVFIFMKGTAQAPQCGFSYNSVEIFKRLGKPFKTFNVLSDPSIREGVKIFSNWPTIPQIYVKGEFIGGNDIVTEMYQNGELQALVADINNQ